MNSRQRIDTLVKKCIYNTLNNLDRDKIDVLLSETVEGA